MADLKKLDALARRLRYRIIETSHKTRRRIWAPACPVQICWWSSISTSCASTPTQPARRPRPGPLHSEQRPRCACAVSGARACAASTGDALLADYGQDGSLFAEHPPTPAHLPGIEAATGSLGHGLPMGVGMALAARIQDHDYNVVVVLGDGECNEGSIWEAAMLGGAQRVERSVRRRRLQQVAGHRPQRGDHGARSR